MATNLAIDPDLLDRALQVSGERTKKAAVTLALQEFIARRQQKRVLDLMGNQDFVHAAKHCSLNVWSFKVAKPRH
jgi:Arc/MetJ family transcription regulator